MKSQTKKSKQQQPQQQPQKQPQQRASAAMIATSTITSNTTPVWIEGGEDGGTVISEITQDHTAMGDDLINILGSWPQGVAGTPNKVPGSPKKGDDGSFTDKPTSIKSASSGSSTTKAGVAKQQQPKQQQPVKPPIPSAAALAQAAAAKAKARAVPIKSSAAALAASKSKATSAISASQKTSPKAAPKTKDAAPSSSTASSTRSRSSSPTAEASAKKKAPHPAMDVSPNPQVRNMKPKALSGRVTPPKLTVPKITTMAMPTATTTATKPAPKTPPKQSPAAAAAKSSTSPAMRKASPKLAPTTPTTNNNKPTSSPGGLSELSKQLRLQRAKNEWQHQEIARLERQLRILSDLKGVSVADLRFSLESACAEEAHAELRNQVLSLQAQLEALQMQRQTNLRRASTANTEAAQSKIATLQLRIGELEEVDQAKQQEVQALYQQLQQQTAKATTLEATNAQQQAQLDKFEQVAQVYVKDVEQIQAERDALKEQVDQLMQQVAGFENQRRLDAAMREIEQQIELEQKRKQDYINQARAARAAGSSVAPGLSVHSGHGSVASGSVASGSVASGASNPFAGPPHSARSLSQSHPLLGVPTPGGAIDPFSSMVRQDDTTTTHPPSESANSSVVTGPAEFDDDVSHLGDDMSVHTMDALLMQGLTEEQAKEALAKDAKITSLYEELRDQATKAAQLQTLCANQKAQIERFAEQLNEKESILKSTQNNYDFAKTEHDSLYKRFCDIELQLTLEQEKVEGLEQQLNARTHESNLRNDQFKCRFQVQNERIADLEQQQSSLYAAFELLQQEVKAQDSEHNKLKESLDEADGEVARQLRESEKKNRRSSRRRSSGADHQLSASQRNLMDGSMTSIGGMDRSAPAATPVATATPVASQMQAFASFNDSSPSVLMNQTPQQLGLDHNVHTYGYLWKLDKIKGWKKRFFLLQGEGGVYQMTYSDSPKERVKGTISNITMGVSTVAETNKSIKKPFSFVLHVDPLNHSGQVLYAAAPNADDFRKWMTALKSATIRPEDSQYMSTPLSQEAQIEADMEIARRLSVVDGGSSHHHRSDQESQIESDHMMAMRMQIQNQGNTAYA